MYFASDSCTYIMGRCIWNMVHQGKRVVFDPMQSYVEDVRGCWRVNLIEADAAYQIEQVFFDSGFSRRGFTKVFGQRIQSLYCAGRHEIQGCQHRRTVPTHLPFRSYCVQCVRGRETHIHRGELIETKLQYQKYSRSDVSRSPSCFRAQGHDQDIPHEVLCASHLSLAGLTEHLW